MEKKLIAFIFLIALATGTFGQKKITDAIQGQVTKSNAEAHLTFLASDELRGRGTGTPEIAIAANYIASQFKQAGLKVVPGNNNYFQEVGIKEIGTPQLLEIALGKDVFKFKEDILLLEGSTANIQADFVFVGYGQPADFDQADVKGKVAVSYVGSSATTNIQEAYLKDSPDKYTLAKDRGAVALLEVLGSEGIPWERLVGFLMRPHMTVAENADLMNVMPHVWMKHSEKESLKEIFNKTVVKGNLNLRIPDPRPVAGKNVIGWIEGTDANLKKEYVILSAHYDHLGVRRNATADSIYNGARDNGIGTTAILEAAAFLAKTPPKRSVLLIALCAEEVGLLGSVWYAAHPLVPLNQCVYNLDCDGAGYDNTSIANLIDLNRTTADDLLKQGCLAFGLTLKGDPAPDQNLYERSDNFSFAAKGIPAVDFSPGVNGLTPEVLKYYHQPADEVQSLDFDYLEKFFRSYVYATYLITNSPVRPFWKPGDKFEPVGKRLYGIK